MANMSESDVQKLVDELDTKILQLKSRWFVKQSKKAQALTEVKTALLQAKQAALENSSQKDKKSIFNSIPFEFSSLNVAIGQARNETGVFRFGKVGKLAASISCTNCYRFFNNLVSSSKMSYQKTTKSDKLLDIIEAKTIYKS
jgi:hypothetical protein